MSAFTDEAVAAIRVALLEFFDESARTLPWRGTRDPYAVWVSEIMAQQTRIETVIPYYERWLERFPDVHALAEAPTDDVLKLWEGLGYYSRARNLHSAARTVRERHGGALPGTYAGLRELPGIGDYTAGAIGSIAFGLREPAVDGNVRRVLSRLLDEPDPSPARLRTTAATLVPADRPGDFNQAIMELGATVCTPRAPRCAACPVAAHCLAYAAGTQLDRPRSRSRKAIPTYDIATAVLRRDDSRVMLERRPPAGLLAGMWSFPGHALAAGEAPPEAVVRLAREYGNVLHGPVPLCTVEHTFSHRGERYDCYVIDVAPHAEIRREVAWVTEDVGGLALPKAQQIIHRRVF